MRQVEVIESHYESGSVEVRKPSGGTTSRVDMLHQHTVSMHHTSLSVEHQVHSISHHLQHISDVIADNGGDHNELEPDHHRFENEDVLQHRHTYHLEPRD